MWEPPARAQLIEVYCCDPRASGAITPGEDAAGEDHAHPDASSDGVDASGPSGPYQPPADQGQWRRAQVTRHHEQGSFRVRLVGRGDHRRDAGGDDDDASTCRDGARGATDVGEEAAPPEAAHTGADAQGAGVGGACTTVDAAGSALGVITWSAGNGAAVGDGVAAGNGAAVGDGVAAGNGAAVGDGAAGGDKPAGDIEARPVAGGTPCKGRDAPSLGTEGTRAAPRTAGKELPTWFWKDT